MSTMQNQPSKNVTSFRKKGTNSVNIRGTRISTQNSQLWTSTGSSTLDFFIGGGLAVGTICLIEEDHYSSYSSLLAKIFLAEGVANNHHIFLSSGIKPSKKILKELPSIQVPETKVLNPSEGLSSENLKIAWRYQSQAAPLDFDIKMESHNHGFDLSKNLPQEMLEKCSVSSWDPTQKEESLGGQGKFIQPPYSSLLEKINSEIVKGGFQTSHACSKHENILRIGLLSLGSPLWNCSPKNESQLLRFLYLLKSFLRKSYAVATITVPSHVTKDIVLKNRIRQICDTVISLESFVGSNKKSNPLFKDFDGLLQVVKLPVLNTFMYPVIVSDLAFKLKRKEFVIQRLHLPPDFEDLQETSSMGCSGKPSKFDF